MQYFGASVRGAYVKQWAASWIHLPDALGKFGSGISIVAVIDTGVDPDHPALKDVLVPGYDFTRDQPGYASEWTDLNQSTVAILDQSTVAILDTKQYPLALNQSTVAILDQSTVAILDTTKLPADFGHGTMVAGLIHLVAPTARIMPLKAFRADGSADLSDIVRAIYYAVDNQARVINMSFSSPVKSPSGGKQILSQRRGMYVTRQRRRRQRDEEPRHPGAPSTDRLATLDSPGEPSQPIPRQIWIN